MRRRKAAALFGVALFLSACGSDAAIEGTGADTIPDPGRDFLITSVDDRRESADGRDTTVAEEVQLEARAWGTGDRYVILAHMRSADMTSWFDFARLLADEGYTAIAFNFRGYGQSEGEEGDFQVADDVRGAVAAALADEATEVFVIGASMGGTGAVAAAVSNNVAGVVTLSAPFVFENVDLDDFVQSVSSPLLLIAADEDGDAANDALAIASANVDAELLVLPGAQHGTNLFAEHGVEITERILEFLTAN